MKRIPWHMCHPKNIQNCPNNEFIGFERKTLLKQYTLQEFFQMSWGYELNKPCFTLKRTIHWLVSLFFTRTQSTPKHPPWSDWPESRNFRNLSFVSKDFTYSNVFELRRHKLMIMKQIIDAVPRNVKVVRLHELERSPEIFIQVRLKK